MKLCFMNFTLCLYAHRQSVRFYLSDQINTGQALTPSSEELHDTAVEGLTGLTRTQTHTHSKYGHVVYANLQNNYVYI